MKFSETLAARVKDLWEEAAEKNFVQEMAAGTLAPARFREYMLQDYLYLLDYIDILKRTMDLADSPSMKAFLQTVIEETENETYRVHVPNMKEIGITDEEVQSCKQAGVIREYVAYMKGQMDEGGLIAGLTALLQCSWVYAYIGLKMKELHPEQIEASPFKSWFDAYTCKEYVDTNQMWIDMVDELTVGISPEEGEKLCRIFEICAGYENRFWDSL